MSKLKAITSNELSINYILIYKSPWGTGGQTSNSLTWIPLCKTNQFLIDILNNLHIEIRRIDTLSLSLSIISRQ